ncbi:hypothetical protein BDZ90DRAFT_229154 [Jaminaea rosea]|uniref:RlpA-like protein double-psi beta-barrel domain-containing protein n=1 Tax=Jaminaea rosea TaxID=1569628 RepID=A0A316UYQ5_9BASI|nr:hypothetical protein BDZ90DRAFT_229154 [Jaminaea rosea]PWN30124.1 hypothetical protein BDZ90DRAFT_229154 [Jaminaea rosea]
MKFAVAASFAAIAATLVAAAPLEKRMHSGATATWFTQNGNPGSCGQYHSDNDMIVAVSAQHHDSSNCGKTITIEANGVQQVATIADTCPGCGFADLDLSTGLFQKFAGLDQGVVTMNWWPNW